mgnify:CR=1 FL=1
MVAAHPRNGVRPPSIETAINVGAVPNEEGRKLITTGVAISQKELDMLEELNSKGIEITVQPMPEISAISFDAVKRKM